MTDTTYIGSELDEEDSGYLKPRKYKIKAQCGRCGKVFSWIAASPGGPDKPCPQPLCVAANMEDEITKRAVKLAKMLDEQRAPGVIGANPIVRAVDTTAEIVMRDHGLTDLKDNIREGDSMAPTLKGKSAGGTQLSTAVDNFFGGVPKAGINRAVAARMNRRVQNTIRGGGGIRVNPSIVAPGVSAGEQAVRSLGFQTNSGAGPNAK